MLLAFSLIIFIIEAQLPPLAPIPGIKLGLANIITLFTLVWFGRKEAGTVLLLRIILSSVFAGGMMSFLYSAAGGLLSYAIMAAVYKLFAKNKLWIVSILGALAHNAGQIAAAIVITSTWQVVYYLPLLAISAVLTGAFTGAAAVLVIKYMPKRTGKDNYED